MSPRGPPTDRGEVFGFSGRGTEEAVPYSVDETETERTVLDLEDGDDGWKGRARQSLRHGGLFPKPTATQSWCGHPSRKTDPVARPVDYRTVHRNLVRRSRKGYSGPTSPTETEPCSSVQDPEEVSVENHTSHKTVNRSDQVRRS